MMIEGKGLGGKKVNRVNMSLSNRYDTKLKRLATSCNMKPTTLAALLIELSLDSPEVVYTLQNKFNVHNAYKVIPLEHNGDVELVLTDKE
ncbi:hypothetical protein P9E34_04125 [Schinkia azotoformans]|uniref:hypothetical protein n=1 Tax=Schinkia azotoformans TaxID=1454 RepID=UPI002DBD3E81|nr:hypothetical protein [Schinkia azotoformans]MEC1723933.1 hypothetical protein [Schinkia azotoformans]